MRALSLAAAVVALLAVVRPAAAEVQAGAWQLLGTADLFLGQYYLDRSAGSLNGYFDVSMQQARSLSAESGFFFSERSLYSGFKQVNELAGGGTLFQQSWDNSLGVKWIKRYEGGFSLKPRVGFRSELFRETKDETWGKGLYDNVRYEAGLAWERKTRAGVSVPWTWELAGDLYYTHYPRFRTLATQFGAALAAPSPGDHVLDAVTKQLTYRNEFDFPGFASAWAVYSVALSDYPQAKIVNSQGAYQSSTRSDVYQNLALGVSKRWTDFESLGRVRPTTALGWSNALLSSNQNNFDTDPNHLKFTSGYFNYWETHVSPSVSLFFLAPKVVSRVGYDFGYRGYSGRLAQNADGTYRAQHLSQTTHSFSLDASYPLLRNLDLKLKGIWAVSGANTSFEQTYRYNYHSYDYFAGVQWKL